jgi:hypothetical protein
VHKDAGHSAEIDDAGSHQSGTDKKRRGEVSLDSVLPSQCHPGSFI